VERLLGQPDVGRSDLGLSERVDAIGTLERVAERRWKGAHLVGGSGVRAPEPVADLARAVTGLATVAQP
jgi:hypothetical protein